MTTDLQITPLSLAFTSGLVLLSVFVSYHEDLSFENDIIIAIIRALIQLVVAGLILTKVFEINNQLLTIIFVLIIIFNASYNSSKRGKRVQYSFFISFISISITTISILLILLLSKSLEFVPSQIIPLTGMIAGNSMSAIGISFSSLMNSFTDNHQKIQEKLALGANSKEASSLIIKRTIKTGLIPVLDQSKTMGIVSLPGMMTGLLFAGVDPLKAIMYQIMIIFVFIATTSISIFISTILAYRTFFSKRLQLKSK